MNNDTYNTWEYVSIDIGNKEMCICAIICHGDNKHT